MQCHSLPHQHKTRLKLYASKTHQLSLISVKIAKKKVILHRFEEMHFSVEKVKNDENDEKVNDVVAAFKDFLHHRQSSISHTSRDYLYLIILLGNIISVPK